MITCLVTETEYMPWRTQTTAWMDAWPISFWRMEAGALDSYPVEAMRSSQITLANKLVSSSPPSTRTTTTSSPTRSISPKGPGPGPGQENVFSCSTSRMTPSGSSGDQRPGSLPGEPVAVNNAGVLRAIKDLRSMAVLYENKRENFLCKHCNIMYRAWVWRATSIHTEGHAVPAAGDLSFWSGRRVWVGLDLAQSDDNTAVSMVTVEGDMLYAKAWGFIPSKRTEIKATKEDVDYKRLITAGNCFACGDEVIDYGFVERFILSLQEKYGVRSCRWGTTGTTPSPRCKSWRRRGSSVSRSSSTPPCSTPRRSCCGRKCSKGSSITMKTGFWK